MKRRKQPAWATPQARAKAEATRAETLRLKKKWGVKSAAKAKRLEAKFLKSPRSKSGPDSRHLRGLEAIDDRGRQPHKNLENQNAQLTDSAGLSMEERSNHPYGGMTPNIQLFWDSWPPEARAAYNVGFSEGADRNREAGAKNLRDLEHKMLKQFHEVVTRIVTRDYGGDF